MDISTVTPLRARLAMMSTTRAAFVESNPAWADHIQITPSTGDMQQLPTDQTYRFQPDYT